MFDSRYLVIQPNLDESVYQLWGRLPGIDGRIVEKALSARETELPVLPEGGSQGQRRADALTTICLDSLTGSSGEGEPGRAVTVAEVFIDGPLAAETYGETGAGLASGPRVGPNTLSEILCEGKIRVIVTDGLHPVAYSDLGEAIPPAIRSFVLWRDQGQCSIEGCPSRYRLQPHHIQQRAHGGNHHPDNLITLCWYHHHVAIHQMGFRIDPDSPTHRRRLIPKHNTGPPRRLDQNSDRRPHRTSADQKPTLRPNGDPQRMAAGSFHYPHSPIPSPHDQRAHWLAAIGGTEFLLLTNRAFFNCFGPATVDESSVPTKWFRSGSQSAGPTIAKSLFRTGPSFLR